MGANNCKSVDDMQPIFDDIFTYQYTILGLHTANHLFWWTGLTMVTDWIWLSFFIALTVEMFQLGMAVECAWKFNIFGSETMERFRDFSYFYMLWALLQFSYQIFLAPTLNLILVFINVLTLGASVSVSVPFQLMVDFGSSFFTLYWTNQVYEAFHPVVAPEVVAASESYLIV